jgi:cation diffusion facilitator family transporter
VALISVIAAVLLTATKLTVGFYTNSLGIISEALHSGIDLIAAAMTFYAVKAAARPPDADHMYGHEKIESLSSLGETALLFITCAWIIYEATNRLFFHAAEVNLGVAALLVMVLSMVVDYTRSRALLRTARKYKSQALEADALHFSTDLLSSGVVIVGILLTMAGFENFDSIAALGVAGVTAVIGYRLWKRSVHTLMDGAPEGLSDVVSAEIMSVEGIHRVDKIRVRESGAITFVEATVLIDQVLPVEQGHRLTDKVEQRIKLAIPNADVMVHAEPICLENASLEERIRAEGATMPEVRSVHNIVITEGPEGRLVEFHVELDGELTVEKGHESASILEDKVARLDPCIAKVVSHIEPVGCTACKGEASERERELIQMTIDQIAYQFPEVLRCHDIHVHSTANGYRVLLCCQFDPQLTVNRAHEVVTRLEGAIRSRHAEVDSVTIHLEPV